MPSRRRNCCGRGCGLLRLEEFHGAGKVGLGDVRGAQAVIGNNSGFLEPRQRVVFGELEAFHLVEQGLVVHGVVVAFKGSEFKTGALRGRLG